MDRVATSERRINCWMKDGSVKTVKTLDDLFHIGVDNLDYNDFGLKFN